MKSRTIPAAVFAAFILITSACGSNTPDPATASSMSSPSSSAVSAPSSSAAPSSSTPPPPPPPTPVAETTPEADACNSTLPAGWDKDCDGQIDVDAPIGDTGCDTSECLIEKNRQESEQGGPVAECANGQVRNEGGGNYSTCVGGEWQYVSPTFDPNSGDGYGPNQPLPPLCVRFPQDYQC